MSGERKPTALIHSSKTGTMLPEQIMGRTASPHFVVTRFRGRFEDRKRRYVVTHRPTGRQLNPYAFDAVDDARLAVRELLRRTKWMNWNVTNAPFHAAVHDWHDAASLAGGIRWSAPKKRKAAR